MEWGHWYGMWPLPVQVYRASKGVYTFKDKYYGRDLSPDGFHEALRDFLQNGICLRTDIIPTLVDMLCRLREMVKQQDSFRFFSSSLLIMYDGKLSSPPPPARPDNCSHTREKLDSSSSPTPPSISTLSHGHTCVMCGDSVMCAGGVPCGGRGVNGHNESLSEGHRHSTNQQPCTHPTSSLEEARKLVDVRMIDFAHTTHNKCVKDPVQYSGPDEGYILGLNTLISAFITMGNC